MPVSAQLHARMLAGFVTRSEILPTLGLKGDTGVSRTLRRHARQNNLIVERINKGQAHCVAYRFSPAGEGARSGQLFETPRSIESV